MHSLPPVPPLPLFSFLPPSLLLILAAFSLQRCSVWFDLSVCRAATPPCFHLTRADEACRHFTTVHFQSRVCFLESLCVPDHCLCYHISTILLSLTVFHNPLLHAASGTTLFCTTDTPFRLIAISNFCWKPLQHCTSLRWLDSEIQGCAVLSWLCYICVSDFGWGFILVYFPPLMGFYGGTGQKNMMYCAMLYLRGDSCTTIWICQSNNIFLTLCIFWLHYGTWKTANLTEH